MDEVYFQVTPLEVWETITGRVPNAEDRYSLLRYALVLCAFQEATTEDSGIGYQLSAEDLTKKSYNIKWENDNGRITKIEISGSRKGAYIDVEDAIDEITFGCGIPLAEKGVANFLKEMSEIKQMIFTVRRA